MDEYFQKFFIFTYSCLFFLIPLLMYHRTSEIFEFNKMLFIYAITFIILLIWFAKSIIYKKIIIKKTPLDIPILLFLFSQILATIFSIDFHTSIFGYYGRFNGGLLSVISYIILFYGFVSNFNVETGLKPVSTILRTSLLSSLIVIFWGLPGKFGYDLTCYLFTGTLSNNCWTDQFKPAERMFSTLGQPNWLGAYLAINFFIALYFTFKNSDKKSQVSQYINILISGFIFSAILFTRSRSALLAVVIGLGLFPINHVSTIIKRYIVLILLLLIPIFLFKTGIPKVDQYLLNPLRLIHPVSSILPTSSKPFVTGITESGDIRKIVWKGAVDLGLKYPFFGTGVETFAYSYYFVRPKEHNLTSEWDFIYNKAHNEYLNYLATTGFVGLGTYLLLIGFIFFVGLRFLVTRHSGKPADSAGASRIDSGQARMTSNLAIKQFNNDNNLLITCLLLAYVSILITNFFGFSTTTVNLYFYLIPAFLVLLTQKQSAISNQQSIINSSFSQKILLIFPVLICLFGLSFPLRYFLADTNYALADNYQKIQDYPKAYYYLIKALSYKNEHVYEDKLSNVLANLAFIAHFEKNKDIDINKLIKLSDQYNLRSLSASPKNVLYWKTRAKNYYLFYQINTDDKDYQKTIDALETAQKLAPTDPKIYYSRAMLYLTKINKENEKKVTEIANKSIELKPDFRDGYYAKGLILKQLGKKEEAKKVFQYILDKLNPRDEETKKEINNL